MKTTYMLILLFYDIMLGFISVWARKNGVKDNVVDAIIKIIPIVMCVIGALGE